MTEPISVKDRMPDEDSLVVAVHIYDFGTSPDAAVCQFLHGNFYVWEDGLSAEIMTAARQ